MVFRTWLLGCVVLLAACTAPAREPTDASGVPSATPAASTIDTPHVSPSNQPTSSSSAVAADPLLTRELVDVRTGDAFTLAELAADGPVLVETMAIWCANCRAQMGEIRSAHELATFHSVSIDIDASEISGDLADYAEQQGFDWPFALADAELASLLRDRFGNGVLNPPSMPKLLVRSDGSVELLPLGEMVPAEEIAAIVGD
jgi:thiol-disulfide isomerase/thioredoxin